MANFIELYVKRNECLILRVGKKEFIFRTLYKLITKILTVNIKKNVFFRLESEEFEKLKNFKNLTEKQVDYTNLDDNSIEFLHSVIHKIKSLYGWKKFMPYISFFTKDELKKLEILYKDFHEKIYINEDGTYQYNKYKLPINSFEASVLYYKHGIEELSEFSLNRIKQADIIDAGAYIGDSAIVLSDYTNKNVYSFECCSEQFNLMKKTIELNNKKNIIPVKLGLSNVNEECTINVYSSMISNTMNKDLNIIPKETEIIQSVTLDSFVEQHKLNVGLIKSDVEGAEQNLIAGSINTIKNFRPVLMISIYHSVSDFLEIKPMIERLNLGYKFKLYKPFDGNILNDTVLIAEIPN